MRSIKITAGNVTALAQLDSGQAADAIWNALPLEAQGTRWGQEIYFSIPVKIRSADKLAVVEKGDLAYWEPGSAFCIFWGPTPASHGDEIRPASPVTVFGKITGDPTVFERAGSSMRVRIERAV